MVFEISNLKFSSSLEFFSLRTLSFQPPLNRGCMASKLKKPGSRRIFLLWLDLVERTYAVVGDLSYQKSQPANLCSFGLPQKMEMLIKKWGYHSR